MRRRLGQHFLFDQNIARKIISGLDLKKTDTVVEIGPGRGVLTQLLIKEAKKVIAVEIDRELVRYLKERFPDNRNVEVVSMDFLKFDMSGYKTVKIVGNIPYSITSPILFHILKFKNWDLAVLMTQKEVGERILAAPGTKKYSAFSVGVQYHCEVEKLHKVSRKVFCPRPQVDSLILRLSRRPSVPVKVLNESAFFQIVRSSFQKRRKKVMNALDGLLKNKKSVVCNRRELIPLLNSRAEELSLEDFAYLTNQLLKHGIL